MDYFNFYILKKLLKNKKVRKIFLFLIIFIILILIKNNVFATIDVEYNNTNYSLADFPSNYNKTYQLISFYRNGTFRYYSWDNPYDFTFSNNYLSVNNYNKSSNPIYYSYYNSSTERFDSTNWPSYNTGNQIIYVSEIAYANFTVSYKDGNGNDVIVYQPPESYENLPHFLNDSDSIAEGGQSLVIMPRRFS